MLGHHDYERNNLGLASRGRAVSLKLATIRVCLVGRVTPTSVSHLRHAELRYAELRFYGLFGSPYLLRDFLFRCCLVEMSVLRCAKP
jgi:hypothetical protein